MCCFHPSKAVKSEHSTHLGTVRQFELRGWGKNVATEILLCVIECSNCISFTIAHEQLALFGYVGKFHVHIAAL